MASFTCSTMITPPSANNNDTHSYAHGSPHSPHTDSNPSIYAQPEYSQEHFISSPSSDYQNLAHSSSSSANSPHTAALQYDSPNPNPQLGNVQLDFIPLPSSRPSAPPQPSTAIPIVAAKHETVPLPYVAPPPPSSPASVPYPVPPSPNTQQQPHYENVTFVDATPIDMSNEKYKLSAAAGGSTIFEDMRNPRKKAFWIFNIIALAIFFGVLGATVWKPDSNKNNGNGNPTPTPSASTTRPAPSNPMVPTPVGPTVPTAVVVPTPVTVSTTRDPPPPTSKPTGTKDEYFRCRDLCGSPWGSCRSNCESSDAAYKACVAPCNGDVKCEVNCKNSNGCLKDCNSTLDKCNSACPSYTP